MKEKILTVPELILIASTRMALGAGIALLVGDRLNKDQRFGAGWALIGLGVLTTIPLGLEVMGKRALAERQADRPVQQAA
jgi:hypothetical protein